VTDSKHRAISIRQRSDSVPGDVDRGADLSVAAHYIFSPGNGGVALESAVLSADMRGRFTTETRIVKLEGLK